MMSLRRKPIEQCLAMADATTLRRSLGAGQLVMLGLSAIVGTGIFILVVGATQRAGPSTIIAFAVAGAVYGAAALCYAELSSLLPA